MEMKLAVKLLVHAIATFCSIKKLLQLPLVDLRDLL
jgi:hypothetical protein